MIRWNYKYEKELRKLFKQKETEQRKLDIKCEKWHDDISRRFRKEKEERRLSC